MREDRGVYELAKRVAPRTLLIRFESTLRRLLYLAYRGDAFECPVCGSHLSRFVTTGKEKSCPRCGSIGRARRLFSISRKLLNPGATVLDFSPSRCLYRKFKADPSIRYLASDFAGEFNADTSYDLTNLPIPDGEFDAVLCFHVLEHITADRAAMSELYRVLRPGGVCVVQTPFKDGVTFEDPTITEPQDRLANFGQEDHVRIYSSGDLADRLRGVGFTVEVTEFHEEPDNRFGFAEHEVVLFASRPTPS